MEVGAELKKTLPGSFVVLVGTHPTALPEETLRLNPKIDAVARYEYDYTLRELAEVLEEGRDVTKVLGLSLQLNGRIIHTPDRPLIENLDELPFVTKVYRKHLDPYEYFFG